MVQAQTQKIVFVVDPQAIKDNTEFVGSKGSTPVSIDAKGWGWLRGVVRFGATDIAMATMKIYYSDDNTTFTSLATGDYSSASTLPSATADNTTLGWDVDLVKYPYRYWRFELIPGDGAAGTFAVAFAILSRAAQLPDTAAEQGFTTILAV